MLHHKITLLLLCFSVSKISAIEDDGQYHASDDGSYVPDDSGRYVPDDSGKYTHQDVKYIHEQIDPLKYVHEKIDPLKYVHDDRKYVDKDRPYIHVDSDKYPKHVDNDGQYVHIDSDKYPKHIDKDGPYVHIDNDKYKYGYGLSGSTKQSDIDSIAIYKFKDGGSYKDSTVSGSGSYKVSGQFSQTGNAHLGLSGAGNYAQDNSGSFILVSGKHKTAGTAYGDSGATGANKYTINIHGQNLDAAKSSANVFSIGKGQTTVDSAKSIYYTKPSTINIGLIKTVESGQIGGGYIHDNSGKYTHTGAAGGQYAHGAGYDKSGEYAYDGSGEYHSDGSGQYVGDGSGKYTETGGAGSKYSYTSGDKNAAKVAIVGLNKQYDGSAGIYSIGTGKYGGSSTTSGARGVFELSGKYGSSQTGATSTGYDASGKYASGSKYSYGSGDKNAANLAISGLSKQYDTDKEYTYSHPGYVDIKKITVSGKGTGLYSIDSAKYGGSGARGTVELNERYGSSQTGSSGHDGSGKYAFGSKYSYTSGDKDAANIALAGLANQYSIDAAKYGVSSATSGAGLSGKYGSSLTGSTLSGQYHSDSSGKYGQGGSGKYEFGSKYSYSTGDNNAANVAITGLTKQYDTDKEYTLSHPGYVKLQKTTVTGGGAGVYSIDSSKYGGSSTGTSGTRGFVELSGRYSGGFQASQDVCSNTRYASNKQTCLKLKATCLSNTGSGSCNCTNKDEYCNQLVGSLMSALLELNALK